METYRIRNIIPFFSDEEMREIRARYDLLMSRGLPVNDTMMSWAKVYIEKKGHLTIYDMVNPKILKAMKYTNFRSSMMDRITMVLREENRKRFSNTNLTPPHPLPYIN